LHSGKLISGVPYIILISVYIKYSKYIKIFTAFQQLGAAPPDPGYSPVKGEVTYPNTKNIKLIL